MTVNLGSPGHAERLAAPAVRQRQAASLLDGNTRRRADLATRDQALAEHRQRVEGGVVIPEICIPHRLVPIRPPEACPYCTGKAFAPVWPEGSVDRPRGSYCGSLDCLLCGRTVATLVVGTRMTPERFRALPSKQRVLKPAPRRFGPCLDCGHSTGRLDAVRCRACNQHLRSEQSLVARMVELLGQYGPLTVLDISRHLGISSDAVRKMIRRARQGGRHIDHSWADGYSLEMTP